MCFSPSCSCYAVQQIPVHLIPSSHEIMQGKGVTLPLGYASLQPHVICRSIFMTINHHIVNMQEQGQSYLKKACGLC